MLGVSGSTGMSKTALKGYAPVDGQIVLGVSGKGQHVAV